ncbi:MAG: hypothetical protein WBI82_00775 [Sphaerochaeta sp.]
MPPFPSQGAIYLTLLSRHSLGNGPMVMLVLLSLRWGMIPEGTSQYLTYHKNHIFEFTPSKSKEEELLIV